jgi:hypothetical protein
LGMTADSDSTVAGEERIGKAKSYPAGTPRDNYAFHIIRLYYCVRSL